MLVKAELAKSAFEVSLECSVEVSVTCGEDLAAGDKVEFQFPNSWLLVNGPSFTKELQTRDPGKPHYIAIYPPGGDASAFSIAIKPRNLESPSEKTRHGRLVTGTLKRGRVPAGAPVKILYANTSAPCVSETEVLWLRIKGTPPEKEPRLVTTPGEAECLRLIAPSGARPGIRFECLAVSLDRFENCSRTEYSKACFGLAGGAVIHENISFTGGTVIPVTLEEEGVYRFSMLGEISNAVKVEKNSTGPYWGDIHIHTKLSHDGQGNNPYGYARNTAHLDFAGTADHWTSLGCGGIRQTAEWVEEAEIPGKFTAVPGYETSLPELQGHHNIYFKKTGDFLKRARVSAEQRKDLEDEWRDYKPDSVMIVPHHTGLSFHVLPKEGQGSAIDINACADSGLRPVAEIYSIHGQSELYSPQHFLSYEINRMRNPERRANTSVPGPYYLQDYWKSGKKIGVIASSDEHSGQGGRRNGGITAVFSEELGRNAIFDAMRGRRCYATTGERILVEFSAGGLEMGQSAGKHKGDEIDFSLKIWGTAFLLRVDILRFRFGKDTDFRPIESVFPGPGSMDFVLEAADIMEGDAVYYARVVQMPLERPGMAWTSPVWFNCIENPSTT